MIVDPASIKLHAGFTPASFNMRCKGELVSLFCSQLQVSARCTVRASQSTVPPVASTYVPQRAAPWKLGFMQAQILETNWAYYRGATPQAGSSVVYNDSLGKNGPCRDYDRSKGHVWCESMDANASYGIPPGGAPSPWQLLFHFADQPENDFNRYVTNSQSALRNELHEARFAAAFVTTLTEQISPGMYRHLQHFLWSILWHARVTTPAAGQGQALEFRLLPGTGFWMSGFQPEAPLNPKYRAVLDNPTLTVSANDLTQKVTLKSQEGWGTFSEMTTADTFA